MVKVDDKIRAIFRKGIRLFYIDNPGKTLKDAYIQTLIRFFNQGYEQRDGISVPIMPPLEEVPTLRQFRYWYKKERELAEAYASGDRQGQLNQRQSSMERCIEPKTVHLSLLPSATASPNISERELLQLIIESTNRRLAKGTIVQVYHWTLLK